MFTLNDINTGISTDTKGYETAKRFASCQYWRPENRDMFSDDFVNFLPYAPMGWLQYQHTYLATKHYDWLAETVRSWEWIDDRYSHVFATDHEDTFFVFHRGKGHIYQWAKEEGDYESLFVHRLTINPEGKITFVQTMFDSATLYGVIGIKLPTWYHDWEDPRIFPGRYPDWVPQKPLNHQTMESLQKQLKDSLYFFDEKLCYISEEIMPHLTDNFAFEIPYAPHNMTRVFPAGPAYYAQAAWLRKINVEEEIGPLTFYRTNDPHFYISEFDCYCYTYWAYVYGHYYNHEISFVQLDDEARVDYLIETFNPMQKWNSTAVSIPSIPQFF